MIGIFIGFPALVLIPAIGLFGLGAWSGSRLAKWTGILWLGYGAYEYAMKLRILCTGECNIRVDLLLIYPSLVILTGVALFRALRGKGRVEH